MPLKLAAISMVRNECDILELFIKINSRVFDAIYILDHMSSDRSYEIVNTLKLAGYPVKYSRLDNTHFSQNKIITSLVTQVANLNEFNYIVPLDADEFFTENPKDIVEKFVSISQFGLIPWKTFCPISEQYFNSTAPLYELFRARASEPE